MSDTGPPAGSDDGPDDRPDGRPATRSDDRPAARSNGRPDAAGGSGPSRDPLIALENVTFGYVATPVLEDVSLAVDPGEYVGILGPNGSGKSTLLRLALGLHEPDTGSIELFGRPARAFVDRERVGYVAQDATGNAKRMPITVGEVVVMGRFPRAGFGRLTRQDRERAREAMETVGIDHLADRRIAQLSGGQRQRAYLARSLAAEADLLVLDEPTVGIDAESVESFYGLLGRLNDEGMTILLVEHDVGSVLEHASRVCCLNREVVFDGPPAALIEDGALERTYGVPIGGRVPEGSA